MCFWCGPYAKKVSFNMSPNFAKYVTPEWPNKKKTKMKSLWGAFVWTYRSLDTARRPRKRLIVWARMEWNRFESLCYSASRILLTWSNNFYQFSKLTTRLQCLPLHNTLPMKQTKWDVQHFIWDPSWWSAENWFFYRIRNPASATRVPAQ